jgi:hypothetical protein
MGRWNLLERRVARFLKEPPSIREAAGVIVEPRDRETEEARYRRRLADLGGEE